MSSAHRYVPHYTVQDYQQWGGDWELWQGIPVAMSPSPFGSHQRIAKNLVVHLDSLIRSSGCDAEVLYEIDWVLAEDTIVRPDVVVVCGEPPVGHLEQTPGLVAEVLSDSTRARDRGAKRSLYAELGVQTYLIIDPDTGAIEVLRLGTEGYRPQTVESTFELSLCESGHISIDRATILRSINPR